MDKKGLKLGGKYKIGKKLGAGAFGEVYLGKLLVLFHSYRTKLSKSSFENRFNQAVSHEQIFQYSKRFLTFK